MGEKRTPIFLYSFGIIFFLHISLGIISLFIYRVHWGEIYSQKYSYAEDERTQKHWNQLTLFRLCQFHCIASLLRLFFFLHSETIFVILLRQQCRREKSDITEKIMAKNFASFSPHFGMVHVHMIHFCSFYCATLKKKKTVQKHRSWTSKTIAACTCINLHIVKIRFQKRKKDDDKWGFLIFHIFVSLINCSEL